MVAGNTSIVMLGTGNAMCTRCYNTCFYVRTPGGGMLVDAGGGNGIFKQMRRAHVDFEEVKHMFVTHVHTDHIMGAVWVIRRISPMMHRGRYKGTFTIYCHDEVKEALYTMCRLMLPAKIMRAVGETIILREVTDGEQVDVDVMKVTFFDIGSDKTKQFGFHAVLPGGTKLVCLGDEPYNECSERWVRGCDWLICEAFCLSKDQE
ncbi:MAG: ribonuclease Z, partial [Muribaculaceae bacterium]|nr:ribonuclease Z [Muribaculaceae bacterium]